MIASGIVTSFLTISIILGPFAFFGTTPFVFCLSLFPLREKFAGVTRGVVVGVGTGVGAGVGTALGPGIRNKIPSFPLQFT